MNDIDTLWLIVYGLVAFALGRWWQTHVMVRNLLINRERIREILERYAREDQQADVGPAEHVEVNAEWHNGLCYLFRADNNEFLGQGADVESAIKQIPKLKPGTVYTVPATMTQKPKA